jgi:hypothetical protein
VGDEVRRDARQRRHAHEHDERVDRGRKARPVDAIAALGTFMSGHHGERGRDATLGDRDACIRGRRDGGAHAGHDLERHARCGERSGLLAAPAEHKRVAALEPHDTSAILRVRDEQRVDLLLRHRMMAAHLSRKDPARARRLTEQPAIDEPVVDDDVGAP